MDECEYCGTPLVPGRACRTCEAYELVTLGEPMTREEFEAACLKADRTYYPRLLAEAWNEGMIDEETVGACVGQAWSLVEFPDKVLDWQSWRSLFDVAGYTLDGQTATRPNEPLTLYRAARAKEQAWHSWTEDLDVARHFLNLRRPFGPTLWVATVEPARLLARLEQDRPGEPQYVVETDGLDINAYGGD